MPRLFLGMDENRDIWQVVVEIVHVRMIDGRFPAFPGHRWMILGKRLIWGKVADVADHLQIGNRIVQVAGPGSIVSANEQAYLERKDNST